MDKQNNTGEMSAAPAAKAGGGAGGRNKAGAATATSPSQQGAGQGGERGAGVSNPGATQGAAGGQTAGQQTGGQGQGQQKGGQGQEQDLLQQAKQTGGEIMNQVQQRAGSQISQQKESAASDLSTIVNAVRQFGESLSGEANGPIARYAAQYGDKAAQKLEHLSTYIREQDPKQLLNDVQNFGRRRPAWLLGGAFILGFAGARLIRSSMEAASEHQDFHSGARRPNLPAPRPSTPSAKTPGPIKPTSNVR